MKSWKVTDARWASLGDLNLPFWKSWNKENPLPDGFWQRIWEYPYIASRVPQGMPSLDVGGTYPFVLFKNWPKAISVDIRDLNQLKHPHHLGKWPQGKLLISDATQIPVSDGSYPYAFSVSAIEEMPNPLAVAKEMLRIAKDRVVLTLDVSEKLGVTRQLLRELEEELGFKVPPIPNDVLHSRREELFSFGQTPKEEYEHIRVLGLTLDSRDRPKSTAILIPHWESYSFLKPCLEAIEQNASPEIQHHVYVLDDSSRDGSFEKGQKDFAHRTDIKWVSIQRENKTYDADVGLLLDRGLEHVTEQYVAMIDADLFPLTKDWLSFPIRMIDEHDCSMAGLDTGLSTAYLPQMRDQKVWQPRSGYIPAGGLYDNDWFCVINNLYRLMPTALAKVVSEQIGFTRATPKPTLFEKVRRRVVGRLRRHMDIDAYTNRRAPYLPKGADNGVAANHFIDINKLGPKFNIPLTSYIGLTPKDGAFGQNISGLAFHFALSTRALSRERREISDAGDKFNYWVARLQDSKGFNDQILKEMVAASTHFQPGGYDGSIPVSWYENEFRWITSQIGGRKG
ncbi:MAG: glycosyltransferase [Bdellovibrionia bacterium]